MAGLFIDVEVDTKTASDATLSAKLVEVCPVSIFEQNRDGGLQIVDENLDECVLCDLCIQAVSDGSVRVIKLYD